MQKRGPKPKPTALKILEGNPGRRELNDLEPACDLPPVKPHTVGADEIASAEWDRIIAAMPPQVYTALDTGMLANYALAWSMLVRAQMSLDSDGLLINIFDRNPETNEQYCVGVKINPAARVWKAASATLIQCADRLGLSPGVRSRLQLPTRDEKPKSKFAGLMNG